MAEGSLATWCSSVPLFFIKEGAIPDSRGCSPSLTCLINNNNSILNNLAANSSQVNHGPKKPFSLIFQNVQCLTTALNKLNVLLSENDVDILTIAEHWKSADEISQWQIPGYKLVSQFCREEGRHGGTAIYCKKPVQSFERRDFVSLSVINVVECSAIQVNLKHSSIVILCIYRPNTKPLANVDIFIEKLNAILLKCSLEKTNFIIAGDFNVNVSEDCRDTREFLSTIEMFNVSLSFSCVTRPASGACLDNIITNMKGYNETLEFHISDHLALKFTLSEAIITKSPSKFSIRCINEQTVNDFLLNLSLVSWNDIYDMSGNVNAMWSCFSSRFKTVFVTSCPLRVVCNKPTMNIWKANPAIKDKKRILDNLLVISTARPEFKEIYNNFKKQYDHEISSAYKSHFGDYITNAPNKSKAVWRVLDSLMGKCREADLAIKTGNPLKLANNFNDFFIGNATHRVKFNNPSQSLNTSRSERLDKSFYFFEVTEAEVIAAVGSLKTSNSSGHDGIPISIVKKSTHIIGRPLAHIMNCAFNEGCFPDDLKIALVKPLFKKGDINEINNYRPISLLSSFAKVFEKILATRLLKFFIKFRVIAAEQHGFTKCKCTDTALFELLDAVIVALEKGEVPMALLFDLSKAFDSVLHSVLLEKLELCGIRDIALKFIESYLSNRRQRVVVTVDGTAHFSEERILSRGVPQGSVLGPLLFLIYINSLCSITPPVKCLPVLYADDSNFLVISDEVETCIQDGNAVISAVKGWCCDNHLTINEDKTQCLFFSSIRSKTNFPSSFDLNDGTNIAVTDSVNFLGIVLDGHLRWVPHVVRLRKRLNKVIYTFIMLKNRINLEVVHTLYYSNFQSLMVYGIIFWGNSPSANEIFLTQKKALRLLCGLGFRDSCRGIFRANNVQTLYGLYIFKLLLFVRQQKHYFEKYLNVNKTRQVFPFNLPVHSSAKFANGPLYMAMKLFNLLPQCMRVIEKTEVFKKCIYKFVLECEPYSLTEFLDYCKK
ncbi:hypothetical protein WA026_016545 [Henosepilachna vigintioctopunctata]|uniref:Reverse transcriptase domain-containing protein n=1 Tax=Henosepilachna vigintioctopunctata TaxID=420089 RepID=A0AAW1VDW0_9CUCU